MCCTCIIANSRSVGNQHKPLHLHNIVIAFLLSHSEWIKLAANNVGVTADVFGDLPSTLVNKFREFLGTDSELPSLENWRSTSVARWQIREAVAP